MIAATMPIFPGVTDLTEPVRALLNHWPAPRCVLGRRRPESPAGFARICGRGAALRCALHIFSYSNLTSEACLKNPEALWEARWFLDGQFRARTEARSHE